MSLSINDFKVYMPAKTSRSQSGSTLHSGLRCPMDGAERLILNSTANASGCRTITSRIGLTTSWSSSESMTSKLGINTRARFRAAANSPTSASSRPRLSTALLFSMLSIHPVCCLSSFNRCMIAPKKRLLRRAVPSKNGALGTMCRAKSLRSNCYEQAA